MSSRDEILKAIRVAQMRWIDGPEALPEVPVFAEEEGGVLVERFTEAVAGVGGNVLPKNELADFIKEKHEVASGIPDEFDGSLDLAQIALPQDLAGLDVFITRAEVGVAENGALWVPEHRLVHRAAAFIAQQVVVLIEPGALVGDMHQAYRAIEVRASGFGVFISGPSKTADIEQSLVLGAHGPRGLTVVLG